MAASLLVGVAISEVGSRLARRWICVGDAPDLPFVPHPIYGWRHPPGVAFALHGCSGVRFEWRTSGHMNSLGLRDGEHPYAKPPGTARILLLGDSMTEALQVPLERSFATLLEAEIRADTPVEVVNGAVASFGTDSALLFFQEEGWRYTPDLVVLVFNAANDVLENSPALHRQLYVLTSTAPLPKPYFNLDPSGTLTVNDSYMPDGVQKRRSVWQFLKDNFYLARLVHRVTFGTTEPAALLAAMTFHLDVHATPVPAPWAHAWTVTEALLRRLAADVDARGARLVVAVLPTKEEVNAGRPGQRTPRPNGSFSDLDRPTRTVAAILERAHIPYLTLSAPLRAHLAASGSTGFYLIDVHLAADGHRVVADALRPFLEAELRAHR